MNTTYFCMDKFQFKVKQWLFQCFSLEVATNKSERNFRFLEEALELVQSCGCSKEEAISLVDYVYNRPVGEPQQEVGGVMVTLAALCATNEIWLSECSDKELERILQPEIIEKIRKKQASKPNAALPGIA